MIKSKQEKKNTKILQRKHRRRFILLLFVPDYKTCKFCKYIFQNVPPKDTKPHFLMYYPPKNPFPGDIFPLSGNELLFFSSSSVRIYILLLYVPAQITVVHIWDRFSKWLCIYTPVICAGTNNRSIYIYRERSTYLLCIARGEESPGKGFLWGIFY